MSRIVSGIVVILRSIRLFSQHVIGITLRQYQLEPLEAVIDSIVKKRGLEFLLIFPRQSGKNEAAAILIVYLLNLFQRTPGTIVFGAIGDGIGRMLARVEDRLTNRWNTGAWGKSARPTRRTIGRYGVSFLSSHPQAAARGDTATHLLVIDELQDQDQAHLEAVFEPMRAANNATALYFGTVRTDYDALWRMRAKLLEAERRDGIRRVFIVKPDIVSAENPPYGKFLANKIKQFGRNHPIIASEYFLEPISQADRLLPQRRIQLLTGTHERQQQPQPKAAYVACIDVGGQDEASTDATAQLDNPNRDHTTITIFEIDDRRDQPQYKAVDTFSDVGSRHFQQSAGKSALSSRILAFLEHWGVIHTIVDGTGVGEGLADWLSVKLGADSVTIVKFTTTVKAALGSTLLALIETGRLKHYVEIDAETGQISAESDAWWFYEQCAACRYSLAAGGQFDKALRWSVPNGHTTNTAAGTVPTHDDRLISFAMIGVIDANRDNIAFGTAESAVIPAADPLQELSFERH